VVLVLAVNISFAQQKGTRNRQNLNHSFILQFNLNYVKSIPDLLVWNKASARSEDIYAGKSFGADDGFGAIVISKIRIAKESKFYFTQSLSYNRIISYDYLKNEAIFDKGYADYNAFSLGAGFEYYFGLSEKVKVFGGAEINGSIINGESDVYLSSPGNIFQYTFTDSYRMGYGLHLGSEHMMNGNVGLSLSIRVQDLNAFIKNAEGNNEETEFTLRDYENPGLAFAGSKEFFFYTLSAGLNIHFGTGESNRKRGAY
jgi:hypothetical protein